jgi:hypothetical protein
MSSGGKLILLRIPTANGEPKVEKGVWWGELILMVHIEIVTGLGFSMHQYCALFGWGNHHASSSDIFEARVCVTRLKVHSMHQLLKKMTKHELSYC